MNEQLSPLRAILLACFVLLLGGIGLVGLFSVGQHEWMFSQTYTVYAEFSTISGIQPGTRVRLQGMEAGLVNEITPPSKPGEPVLLTLKLDQSFQSLIREDATATLATQGVIGSKVVEILPGTTSEPPLADRGTIATVAPVELNQVLSDTYEAGQELRQVGQRLNGILSRVENLTAQVERGEGSMGKFITSEEAHDSALQLMETGEELMTSMDETVLAFRRIWPLRDYFIQQGMNDPDDLLYRPGAKRESRSFPIAQLFDESSSVLTADGKRRLDQVAEWLKSYSQTNSEIIIAGFAEASDLPAVRTQRLTQEQASAVREYLVNEHSVNRIGYFGSRDVTAAGFGQNQPAKAAENLPDARIEILLFLPPSG
ncbi:Hypothetical protein PBC10988_25060 [Planctomycetales bacterium 10988]|nr:Hypothetical protein PBC10988_25060 [Planctomycetales bacterium 10988]